MRSPPSKRRPHSPDALFLLASLLARLRGLPYAAPLLRAAADLSPRPLSQPFSQPPECGDCEGAAAAAATALCQLALADLLAGRPSQACCAHPLSRVTLATC